MGRVQLANYFKQQAYEVIGVNPQRMGQQLSQTTATGVEQAVSASYAQTETYFIQHCDYLMPRVQQMRTDLAQYYQSTNPSLRLSYMTSNDEKVNFQMNGVDLLLRDLNIFATTNANHRSILEQLKNLMVNNNTTGASIYDLGKIMQSDSIAQLNNVLKDSEQKITAQKQQEQQGAQQMQEQQLQELASTEKAKMDHESQEAELNRRRDIMVAEIRAAGMGALVDIDQNSQSDFTDEMDNIRNSQQYQEQTGLQREKESNRNYQSAEKNQIEREKIQAQKEIADKQLQIARENKNKYDVKSKDSKKK